jgi:hypothetical protein
LSAGFVSVIITITPVAVQLQMLLRNYVVAIAGAVAAAVVVTNAVVYNIRGLVKLKCCLRLL